MKSFINERNTTCNSENYNRRNYIINNYKEFIPDIEKYIYEKSNRNFDYTDIGHEYKRKIISEKFNVLSNIVVDIRNNTSPTTYYSNSISRTDNKYSNETKNMVKGLLAKGWSNNEVAYELEKIYGTGIISYNDGLVDDTPYSSKITIISLKIMFLYIGYRMWKFMFLGKTAKKFTQKYNLTNLKRKFF